MIRYKFLDGAYLVIIAMMVLFALMKAIHMHYRRVSEEVALSRGRRVVLPSNNHAVVLVSTPGPPTMARPRLRQSRHDRPRLIALTVNLATPIPGRCRTNGTVTTSTSR